MKCPVCNSKDVVFLQVFTSCSQFCCRDCKCTFNASHEDLEQYKKGKKVEQIKLTSSMTFEEFDQYQERLIKSVFHMKMTKGKEYAHSKDRFANFNRLAERLEESNLKIAWIYFMKHIDSIESYIKDGKVYSNEGIQGRIIDAVTYLTLIGGMIEARESMNQCTQAAQSPYLQTRESLANMEISEIMEGKKRNE